MPRTRPDEQARLVAEARRLAVTSDALLSRLQRTLLALALTLDARALAEQQLAASLDDHRAPADLQTAAALYRHLAKVVAEGAPGWPESAPEIDMTRKGGRVRR